MQFRESLLIFMRKVYVVNQDQFYSSGWPSFTNPSTTNRMKVYLPILLPLLLQEDHQNLTSPIYYSFFYFGPVDLFIISTRGEISLYLFFTSFYLHLVHPCIIHSTIHPPSNRLDRSLPETLASSGRSTLHYTLQWLKSHGAYPVVLKYLSVVLL